MTNINEHNERAWDLSVQMNNRFTVPINEKELKRAKEGLFELSLCPNAPLPKEWYKDIKDKSILVLAGGGGRQAPLLAMAGAHVCVVDISGKQLDLDQAINDSFNLNMDLKKLSADDLGSLKSDSFDLIVNPLSNCFFENLDKVWEDCSRILKKDGEMLYAFNNPIAYLFDFEKANRGEFIMKYSCPYSDMSSLSIKEKKKFLSNEGPLEFGHSLSDQIGRLLKKGMIISDMFESYWDYDDPLNHYFPQFINIRAKKI